MEFLLNLFGEGSLMMVGFGSSIIIVLFLLMVVFIFRISSNRRKPKRTDLERIEHKLDTIIKNQEDQR
ncbi:hypothetical protein QUF79_08785 [Fictibacillus enclensis]|uniref:hypothetical protein n=1 Tax=Fictibacillus enclensis TaxID=1017270 RepID=UPI0025A02688|nr:hypothetical protein [Fictibacillus enclensis]MDM5198113.1 hypothetical protein [Fictibacillus enclensis]